VVLGIAPDPQTSSQAQTSLAQTGDTNNSDKDVTVENSKTGETSNSVKEVLTEKSKESSVASWMSENSVLDESEVAPEEVAVPAKQLQA